MADQELKQSLARISEQLADIQTSVQNLSLANEMSAALEGKASVKVNPKLVYAAPRNSFWYMDVRKLPVHKFSDSHLANIGRNTSLHADFGSPWEDNGVLRKPGIPITTESLSSPTEFAFLYTDESDTGPYLVGEIEDGSDRHSIVYDSAANRAYELFNTYPAEAKADSGAKWSLSSNQMRLYGWTSADAAGLPIILGLVRYDELLAGEINHMIRMTLSKGRGFYWPASHLTEGKAGEEYSFRPPLGAVFRLKESFDLSSFHPFVQIILRAMQVHGIIYADNGSDVFISGCPDARYDNVILAQLRKVKMSEFEEVDMAPAKLEEGSYAVKPEYIYVPS